MFCPLLTALEILSVKMCYCSFSSENPNLQRLCLQHPPWLLFPRATQDVPFKSNFPETSQSWTSCWKGNRLLWLSQGCPGSVFSAREADVWMAARKKTSGIFKVRNSNSKTILSDCSFPWLRKMPPNFSEAKQIDFIRTNGWNNWPYPLCLRFWYILSGFQVPQSWGPYLSYDLPGDATGKGLTWQCRRPKRRRFNQSLGWEDPLEEDMTTHSSILAWRIPWTEEPGGL